MAVAPQDPDGGITSAGLRADVPSAAAYPGGIPLVAFPGSGSSGPSEALIGIDDVQNALNRSRASVYRYTNTDPRNLNPPFNPRRLNPEYRTDQKDPLQFHPNEVARFARDVLRIKEVTVEVLNSPSTVTQELLGSILEELQAIRGLLNTMEQAPGPLELSRRRESFEQSRPAA
ncbi:MULTISPECIES: hypothetical protein [unclassified Synechococcus]|uniref:hypothetical protein n=1 Tax=unclassified Synechococcus TaxID=2626047 RepID=UPI0021A95E0F|nr:MULTISPECIES: hypothetical protein [unclassified Synechococcus]